MAVSISFLARRRFTAVPGTRSTTVPVVCCWEGRIVITPDWSRPFLSLPSFVSAVQTAFCHSCQWSFQKQESRFLWPLGERTVYLMSGTSNKCLCSQCRNNPRQKKTVAMWRIRKKWGREITSQAKEEAVSPTRFTREKWEPRGCQELLRARCPQPPRTATVPREAAPCQKRQLTPLPSMQAGS